MLQVTLFGRLDLRCCECDLTTGGSQKAFELLCFLLLHRDRPYARELLASLLWGDHGTTGQSRKYLRNALWQLQGILSGGPGRDEQDFLCVEPEWIRLRTCAALWLDVEVFEQAYRRVKDVPGRNLDAASAAALDTAVGLYRGPLLENWFQDWCVSERERLLQTYLLMLDKLAAYAEGCLEFERALAYGRLILACDGARERTHRQMMRLYYLAGDRSSALRQYHRCADALRQELDVAPAESTTHLYDQIRCDRLDASSAPDASRETLQRTLQLLQQLQSSLDQVQHQVRAASEETAFALRDGASFRSPGEQPWSGGLGN